jgi:hypothetical protein
MGGECRREIRCSPDVNEMPLWQAATLAYREVLATRPRRERPPSNDELDLVALVLSGYVPIYAAEPEPIGAEELDQGMFWGGARRFESRARPPRTGLKVRRDELERALERIRADLWPEP